MKTFVVPLFLFFTCAVINAQDDDLMSILENDNTVNNELVTGTFKSTRVMNGHSTERMTEGVLDFRISHRFGRLNTGAYEFFGLDQANIRLGLEYGMTDWLMAGIGRGSYEKTFDGFLKFSIFRQSTGKKAVPVSLSFLSAAAVKTLKNTDPLIPDDFSSRLSYTEQVLVARKFNQWFSFQLSPTLIHYNHVLTGPEPVNLWALGSGGRIRLSKRITFNAEYYVISEKDQKIEQVYNPLSVGFDIETGGHVFQLIFTNSEAMIEKGFIGETLGNWADGDIHFGFNISRVFSFKKDKDLETTNY